MTRYQVDSEAVATATGIIRATAGRMQSDAAGMYAQLVDLQSSWTGSASTAFQGVASEWRTTQLRLEESLNAIAVALAQAGQVYADVEAQNARMFGR